MIYVVINGVMAAFLLWFAYFADKQTKGDETNPLVVLDIELTIACALCALMIASALKAPINLTLFLARILYVELAFFCTDCSLLAASFPLPRRPGVFAVFRVLLLAFALFITFSHFKNVNISPFLGLNIYSDAVFKSTYTNYFPYSWYDLYRFVYFYFVPALSVIIMMLRTEAQGNRLFFQRAVMTALSIAACWFVLFLLSLAAKRVPMFSTLFPLAFVLMMTVLVYSTAQNILYDGIFILGLALRFILCYVLPSLLVGFLFPKLWPIMTSSPPRFILLILVVIAVAVTLSHQLEKLYQRFFNFRSIQYANLIEKDLAKMDYSGEPIEIVKAMENIFVRNIGVAYMRVLVDNGMGLLESVYNDKALGREKIVLKSSEKTFDLLLNQNRTIVLKSLAETGRAYPVDRDSLLAVFAEAKCDAMILLTEGRRIMGAILLGPKAGGNVFTDYDAGVFAKLYSYFFVFGYYMKNIANQSVVGTVNREIHMSSQIITSIQENMDPIKNPKADVGYIMKHAHNIGGEFVDLIKLSADKHIFVLGDLSGKGISASMSMVIIKSIIRTFLAETKDFKLLIEKVNRFIRFNLPKGTFFEGVFGLVDFSSNTMYYINCGVPAMFLYSRSFNNIIEIQGEGRVLGFVKDIGPLIKVKKTALNPGDIIVACTDGLIDCLSLRGEPFGKNRVQKAIMENIMYPAEKMAQFAYDALVSFISKELDDDVSVFVMKWQGK